MFEKEYVIKCKGSELRHLDEASLKLLELFCDKIYPNLNKYITKAGKESLNNTRSQEDLDYDQFMMPVVAFGFKEGFFNLIEAYNEFGMIRPSELEFFVDCMESYFTIVNMFMNMYKDSLDEFNLWKDEGNQQLEVYKELENNYKILVDSFKPKI